MAMSIIGQEMLRLITDQLDLSVCSQLPYITKETRTFCGAIKSGEVNDVNIARLAAEMAFMLKDQRINSFFQQEAPKAVEGCWLGHTSDGKVSLRVTKAYDPMIGEILFMFHIVGEAIWPEVKVTAHG